MPTINHEITTDVPPPVLVDKEWRIRRLHYLDKLATQQSVQLTALRRVLAVSIFINLVLLAVALYAIGGN